MCVAKLSMTKVIFSASPYHLSAILLINLAQSNFVFLHTFYLSMVRTQERYWQLHIFFHIRNRPLLLVPVSLELEIDFFLSAAWAIRPYKQLESVHCKVFCKHQGLVLWYQQIGCFEMVELSNLLFFMV